MKTSVHHFLRSFVSSFRARARFERMPGFMEAYREEVRDFAVARARILFGVGILCYLSVSFMDWMLYPKIAPIFIGTRIVFTSLTALSLALSATSLWRKYVIPISFVNLLVGDLIISYMASQISGWTSLYFAGGILVTTGAAMFIPWRPRVMLLYSFCTVSGYTLINCLYHPLVLDAMIPIMFLLIVGVLAYFSTIEMELSRMRQLAARLEISRAHEELKKQSTLLQQQIEAAKDIQQALLPPRIQEMRGLQIEAIYEPSAHLSGDFFDAIVSGDWVYVYLADVTGHGLPAAQITFLVKEIFKNALTREIALPDLFDEVRHKYVDHQLGYDLGLQLVRIHSKTLEVECLKSNAPNPILIGKSGEASELDVPASPLISASLGVSESQKAKLIRLPFDPATKFYLYSDGAYEFTTASGREFGHRRLMKTLASTHNEPWPEGLTRALRAENKDEFFPDDLTVLRIRILGTGK